MNGRAKNITAYFLGVLSLAILLFTIIVHVYALVPSAASILDLPDIFLPLSAAVPSIGGIIVFLAMGIAISEQGHRIRAPKSRTLRESIRISWRRESLNKRRVLSSTPSWARAVLLAGIVYAVANGVADKVFNDRQPVQYDSSTMSWDEYKRLAWEDSRNLSGSCIFFSLPPTIYFLIVRPRLQASDAGFIDPSPDATTHL